MSQEKYFIPKYSDQPGMLFIFTPDEWVVFLTFVFGGFMIERPLAGLICAVTLSALIKSIKKSAFWKDLPGLAYWNLPRLSTKHKPLPDSAVREYIG